MGAAFANGHGIVWDQGTTDSLRANEELLFFAAFRFPDSTYALASLSSTSSQIAWAMVMCIS